MPSLRTRRWTTKKSALAASTLSRRQHPTDIVKATDEESSFVIDWWRRMHRGRRPLVAVAVKSVTWSADGAEPERCICEVCKWPQRDGFVWHFICWRIDGLGVWWKAFPSKRAAMAYYRQAPDVVMAQPQSAPTEPIAESDVREGMQYAAAS